MLERDELKPDEVSLTSPDEIVTSESSSIATASDENDPFKITSRCVLFVYVCLHSC